MQSIFMSFDMEKLSQYTCTIDNTECQCSLIDAVVLDYIARAIPCEKLKHIKENNISYVWLQHEHVIEDMPILRITKGRLRQILTKLKDMKLVDCHVIANTKVRGSKAYYALTENSIKCLFNEKLTTFYSSQLENANQAQNNNSEQTFDNKKLIQVEEPVSKNYESNSKLISNSNINNSKELYKKIGNDCTQLNSNCKSSFLGSNKRSKKLSRVDKIESLILNFTDNEKLRSYIRLYFSNCRDIQKEEYGKDFYVGMASGALTRLSELSSDTDTQIKIVAQSVELGYRNLYMPKDNNRKYNNKSNQSTKVRVEGGGLKDTKTIDKTEENEKFWKELEESGKTAVY